MFGLDALLALLTKHGLLMLAPIAVLEGPIVTVIAAWLASQHLFDLWRVSLIVILADLVGDFLLYALGRWGLHRVPPKWRDRLGLRRGRLCKLGDNFRQRGTGILIFGKLTHSIGAPILVAAGVARMPLWRFLRVNACATIPKSLAFVALGYSLGAAYSQIDTWIGRASALLFGVTLFGVALWFWRKRVRK